MFVPGSEVYDVVIPPLADRSTSADFTATALVCYCTPANPCSVCNACNCPSSCPAICPCRGSALATEGSGPSGEEDPLYRAWRSGRQVA